MAAAALTLGAVVLSGCSSPDDFMSSVALPPNDTTVEGSVAPGQAAPPQGKGSVPPSTLMVSGQQRAYLDALVAAGVRPSSDLQALSIGSYVCQANAAGQSPQAVWDFVHPLVSNDVHTAHMSSTEADIDATTGSYIRVATERLC